MSATLNTSGSFSTLSSSVYSPTLPPTPGTQQPHISNLTDEQFFLYPTAFGTIRSRRACKQDSSSAASTSASETLTMIPVDLIETIEACRSPVPTTTSRVTGRKLHLFTTSFGTIRLRRTCQVRYGKSVALANAAQALTMFPVELREAIELFRPKSTTRDPPPISNLTDQPFYLQSTAGATIKLRRASRSQGPYASYGSKNLTMIPTTLLKSFRTSRISFLTSATQKRVQKSKQAKTQHPQRLVKQDAEFYDLTKWLQELASESPIPVGKCKKNITCEQDEEFDNFEQWLDAAQLRVEEDYVSAEERSSEELVRKFADTLL